MTPLDAFARFLYYLSDEELDAAQAELRRHARARAWDRVGAQLQRDREREILGSEERADQWRVQQWRQGHTLTRAHDDSGEARALLALPPHWKRKPLHWRQP